MGLDDVSRLQLIVPMMALLVTIVASGPASLVSFYAWKGALVRLTKGQPVGPARWIGMVALALTGGPLVYCLLLVTSLPGVAGTLGLVLVAVVAVSAHLHAAYRVECIREVSAQAELTGELAAVQPSFVGATRGRSLLLAGSVLLAWCMVAGMFAVQACAR